MLSELNSPPSFFSFPQFSLYQNFGGLLGTEGRAEVVRDRIAPPVRGPWGITSGEFFKVCFLSSGAMSTKKLASVGVQNGTMKSDYRLLLNSISSCFRDIGL